jgi:Holliday junction resolvase RusA-like endonuclease
MPYTVFKHKTQVISQNLKVIQPGQRADYANPLTIVIGGAAVPKGRPRMTRRGHTYTPEATRNHERTVGGAARAAMAGRPPITGAVKLAAVFELPIPQSWSERKRGDAITGAVLPAARPDLDNFVKALLDGINGIVVRDDGLITDLHARKRYSVDPKTVVTVTPLDTGVAS